MGKLKDIICYDSPVSYYDHELRAGVDKWEYPERRDNLLLEFTITEMFAASKFAIARVRVTREQGGQEFYWKDDVRFDFAHEWTATGFRFSSITPPHECYVGMLEELDQKLGVVLRNAAEEIERRTRKFVNETTEDAVDNAIYQERNKS
jgi:hypothetical protein